MNDLSDRDPADVENLLLDLIEDVRTQQLRLRESMHAGMNGQPGQGHNEGHIAQVRELSAAVLSLSREARAWAKQNRDLGKRLTREQRIDLLLSFCSKLGPTDRKNLAKRILELP